ncbi:MAG: flagellar hook-basal body complex protein FliE [Rhizobiaceae bacterium]|nr:flagellar hook-basal body complex protein FliE [Rhizobiaceae bacterium]
MIESVGLIAPKLGASPLDGPEISSAPSGIAADNVVGKTFSELLSAAANRTVDTLANAEDMSVKAMQGGADTREVVDAVMNAEQSLQAAIAIRDKIVSAYLDISRMAI